MTTVSTKTIVGLNEGAEDDDDYEEDRRLLDIASPTGNGTGDH